MLISSASGSESDSDELSIQLFVAASESGYISEEATPSKSPLLPLSSALNRFVPWANPTGLLFEKSRGKVSFACISVKAGWRPDLNRRISPVLFLI